MKKCGFFILSLVLLVSSGNGVARAADPDPREAPKKVVFYQLNRSMPEKPGGKTDDSFDYLSLIIPANMIKDIEKEKKFILENAGEVPLWNSDENRADADSLLAALKETAAAKGADFIVTGFFSADKKMLSVECSVYVVRTSKTVAVKASSETGVIIDALIGNLSANVAEAIERNILKPAPSPSILPAENSSLYYEHITIVPDQPGDEIWYTTDGETPSREKGEGDKYTGEFSVRRSSGIKAVSYREGFYESKTAEKEMTIRYPVRYLTAGVSFPSFYYLGNWGTQVKRTGGTGTSVYIMWECANVYSARQSLFWRNMGLIAGADSWKVYAKDSSGSATILSPYMGIVWIIRAADFLNFNIIPQGGYSRSAFLDSDNGDSGGPFSSFSPVKDPSDVEDVPWAGIGGYMNISFSHFFVRTGVTYRRIFYGSDYTPADAIGLEYGIGWRF